MGGAAALAAIGFLVTPTAPAQADYDCYKQGGYQFPGGEVVIHYPETDSENGSGSSRAIRTSTPLRRPSTERHQLDGRITGDMEKGGTSSASR